MINDAAAYFDANAQFNYNVTTDGTGFNEKNFAKRKLQLNQFKVLVNLINL